MRGVGKDIVRDGINSFKNFSGFRFLSEGVFFLKGERSDEEMKKITEIDFQRFNMVGMKEEMEMIMHGEFFAVYHFFKQQFCLNGKN